MSALPSLETIRSHCRTQLAALPQRLLALTQHRTIQLLIATALEADARRLFTP